MAGIAYRKNKSEKIILSAEHESERIMKNSKELAETRKKEIIVEGKEEVHKFRIETEKELYERRKDLQRQEKRIQQKEETLDKKSLHFEEKEQQIQSRLKDTQEKELEIDNLKKTQFDILEKISGFSTKQAKSYIIESLQDELVHEKAMKVLQYEQELKENCEKKAKEILSTAIQRCASDHSSEIMISVVPLPNDDMKGRIIGREGRNIRSIENLTGVDLIIDDTPEAITLSSFDPVRREIARLSLERLISDGRIHPAKIEETVEKVKIDINKEIKEEGEKAVLETRINHIHPELVKLIGRLKYRTSYGQNILKHSLEVAHLCGIMASELGLDATLARRCGLLHDIGKALDHEIEGSHVDIGVDVAKKYKENNNVIHAIHAHHGDIEPQTEIALILQAADAISAARPGARRENLETYIKRLEKLETLVSSFTGVEKCFAIQAGREIRVMIKPDVVNDEKMIFLARNICKKIEADLDYPGQVKVSIIRETRIVEYAK